MNVRELREVLENFEEDLDVAVIDDDGNIYSSFDVDQKLINGFGLIVEIGLPSLDDEEEEDDEEDEDEDEELDTRDGEVNTSPASDDVEQLPQDAIDV